MIELIQANKFIAGLIIGSLLTIVYFLINAAVSDFGEKR